MPAVVPALMLLLLAEVPPLFEGSKLAPAPGPQTPPGPDLAAGPGPGGLDRQVRSQARRAGTVPAVQVPAVPSIIEDKVAFPSGWKAYRVTAPAGATLHARLRSQHEGWFRVRAVNKWGALEQGMLQNRIETGNPEASFINPKNSVVSVYFIVDTTMDGAETETFRIELNIK